MTGARKAFLGLTYQITDKLMLGGLYRTKSDVGVDGDIKFTNISNPIENRITSNLDKAKIKFDYPQVIRLGLKYDAADNLTIFADFDWEDWSQFSENTLSVDGTGPTTIVETIDRNWKYTAIILDCVTNVENS